jgi:hypothetical protein
MMKDIDDLIDKIQELLKAQADMDGKGSSSTKTPFFSSEAQAVLNAINSGSMESKHIKDITGVYDFTDQKNKSVAAALDHGLDLSVDEV